MLNGSDVFDDELFINLSASAFSLIFPHGFLRFREPRSVPAAFPVSVVEIGFPFLPERLIRDAVVVASDVAGKAVLAW